MPRRPAKRARMPRRVIAQSMQPRGWSLGTYLQWVPVFITAVGVVASYVHQGDRIDSLEKEQPTVSIAAELTNVRDRIDTSERDIGKLESKESADVAELKNGQQQLWQYVGHIHGVPPP